MVPDFVQDGPSDLLAHRLLEVLAGADLLPHQRQDRFAVDVDPVGRDGRVGVVAAGLRHPAVEAQERVGPADAHLA